VGNAQKRIQNAALQLFAERGIAQVTVSDLAEKAGVARGTIYNNFKSIDSLFEDVAAEMTSDMLTYITASSARTSDPAQRVANGIRFYVRRAHEEPKWGHFLIRFGTIAPTLRPLLQGVPMSDLKTGIEIGRFSLRTDQLEAALGILQGAVLAAISLVLEGRRTWRDAGTDLAELSLRALGVQPDVARSLATAELPSLAIVE
jgi:AcrR family transcriptional regulator